MIKIALVGNPNSGKTTVFNELTGKAEKVGNFSGITVEEKVSKLKKIYNNSSDMVDIVDLPGTYSIFTYTKEEEVTKKYIDDNDIDVIINVVDSTNLERSLFFTLQLLKYVDNTKIIIALNKTDLSEKNNEIINIKKLSEMLKVPVVEISANKSHGISILMAEVFDYHNNKAIPKKMDIDIDITDDIKIYEYVDEICPQIVTKDKLSIVENISDKIDAVVLNKYLGVPIFFGIIWFIFYFSQSIVGTYFSEILVYLFSDLLGGFVQTFMINNNTNLAVQSLVLDGIIGGFSAVISFLPLIMSLLFCLSLLEDSGYLARVAVLFDKYFNKIGLSGKSVIPLIMGAGCAVPALMSTRTIKNESQRKTTAIITPFIPCGAKLPIIASFTVVFFGGNAIVGPLVYLMAIAILMISGLTIKYFLNETIDDSFIIELPNYKVPSFKIAYTSMFDKAKAFIERASSIILISNIVIWFLQYFTFSLNVASTPQESMLAVIASPLSIILYPLGFASWEYLAASVTGIIAKENVVGTLAVTSTIFEDGGGLNAVQGFAFMCFNLFTPPCAAAIGALYGELNSKKMLVYAVSFQLAVGYYVAMLINQIGTPIAYGYFADGLVESLIIIIITFSTIKIFKNKNKCSSCKNCSSSSNCSKKNKI